LQEGKKREEQMLRGCRGRGRGPFMFMCTILIHYSIEYFIIHDAAFQRSASHPVFQASIQSTEYINPSLPRYQLYCRKGLPSCHPKHASSTFHAFLLDQSTFQSHPSVVTHCFCNFVTSPALPGFEITRSRVAVRTAFHARVS